MSRFKLILLVILAINCVEYVNAQSSMSIMTYNIKLDYPKEGENSWENRKQMFLGQLKFYEPDVLGVQEALPNQMKDIDDALINYDYVGVGRDDGKAKGEFSAIFYNLDKIKVIQSSTFWLSETPNTPSKGWDAAYNRICTYALFENVITKNVFWVFNTHFDHVGDEARLRSAELVIQKIEEINSENLPVFLMGDFNLEPETSGIKYIKSKLNDSKEVSESTPFGPVGTYNNFDFDKPVHRRIDYIFINDKIKVLKHATLSDNTDLKYPSDHLPVFIEFKFNK